MEAIRHGYVETERFAQICATIVTHHAEHGGAAWLVPALDDTSARSRRTRRALNEIIMTAMGLVRACANAACSTPPPPPINPCLE